jgi:hypothetical protein
MYSALPSSGALIKASALRLYLAENVMCEREVSLLGNNLILQGITLWHRSGK